MKAEIEYPPLHVVHGTPIEQGDVAVVGLGASITDYTATDIGYYFRSLADYYLRSLWTTSKPPGQRRSSYAAVGARKWRASASPFDPIGPRSGSRSRDPKTSSIQPRAAPSGTPTANLTPRGTSRIDPGATWRKPSSVRTSSVPDCGTTSRSPSALANARSTMSAFAAFGELVKVLETLRELLGTDQGLLNQDALVAEVEDLCQMGANLQLGLRQAILDDDMTLICWLERSRQTGEVSISTAPLEVAVT